MQTLCRALLIAAIVLPVAPAQRSSPKQQPAVRCGDVTKLDVRNLTIRTAQREFAFHNGIAIDFDGYEDRTAGPPKPDWEAEIVGDKVIHPAPNVTVRFLVIHDSHETGSGWQIYLTGFLCEDGKLKEVFHRNGMSLDTDRVDSTAIVVSLNVVPGKPIRKHYSYTWDVNTSKYVLSATFSTPK